MSKIIKNSFVFSHSVAISADLALYVWDMWNNLSEWQNWDVSLKGTESIDNSLSLGQSFFVLPKVGPNAIEVCVTAFIKNTHFTTTASTPVGLLSFGHTLLLNDYDQDVNIEHSICAVPTNINSEFPRQLLEKLQADVIMSVNKLSNFILERDKKL